MRSAERGTLTVTAPRDWRKRISLASSGLGPWGTGLSIAVGLLVWQIASVGNPVLVPSIGNVWAAFALTLGDGALLVNIASSVARILEGFFLALVLATALGFVIGWYRAARIIVDPWIQFFRMIPPIALLPLVVVYLGVGNEAQVSVIFFSAFMVMLITIFQGVQQIDSTMVRAARVLGCKDRDLFLRVILPASVPYIFTAARIGVSAAWTALVAAELIAASEGLGFMIEQASQFFEMSQVYLGIIAIGMIGLLMDRLVLLLQRRFTSWQDVVAR